MCRPTPSAEDCRESHCYYGYCKEWVCPSCHKIACGFGPVGCKCDAPRSFIYPDMSKKAHVPLKRSTIMRKQKRSKRSRKQ